MKCSCCGFQVPEWETIVALEPLGAEPQALWKAIGVGPEAAWEPIGMEPTDLASPLAVELKAVELELLEAEPDDV